MQLDNKISDKQSELNITPLAPTSTLPQPLELPQTTTLSRPIPVPPPASVSQSPPIPQSTFIPQSAFFPQSAPVPQSIPVPSPAPVLQSPPVPQAPTSPQTAVHLQPPSPIHRSPPAPAPQSLQPTQSPPPAQITQPAPTAITAPVPVISAQPQAQAPIPPITAPLLAAPKSPALQAPEQPAQDSDKEMDDVESLKISKFEEVRPRFYQGTKEAKVQPPLKARKMQPHVVMREQPKPFKISKSYTHNDTKEVIDILTDDENNKEEKQYKFKRLFEVNRVAKDYRREKSTHAAKDDNDSEVEFIGAYYPSFTQKVKVDPKPTHKSNTMQMYQLANRHQMYSRERHQQRTEHQPRKIQKVSETREQVTVKPVEAENKQAARQTFDLDLVMKYTNKLFIELIRVNNMNTYENCELFGFNRHHQKEFITLLMRHGIKENSIEHLYTISQASKGTKKQMEISLIPKENFIRYAKNIVDFIEFLMIDSRLRSVPHFILNDNTAYNVKFCLDCVRKLSKILESAKNNDNNMLFNGHVEYLDNIKEYSQRFNWSWQDDFYLLLLVSELGFQNYRSISNSPMWLKTSQKVLDYAKTNNMEDDLLQVATQLNYKMPWESLFERVFDFDIVKA